MYRKTALISEIQTVMICDIPVLYANWSAYAINRQYQHLAKNTCSIYKKKSTYKDHFMKHILFSFF